MAFGYWIIDFRAFWFWAFGFWVFGYALGILVFGFGEFGVFQIWPLEQSLDTRTFRYLLCEFTGARTQEIEVLVVLVHSRCS